MKSFIGILLFSFIFFKSYSQETSKEPYTKLRPFTFYTLDGKEFTQKDVKYKNKAMFIYYSPKCLHCVVQAQDIYKKAEGFKNYTMYWISVGSPDMIKSFYKAHLKEMPNCVMLHDKDRTSAAFFDKLRSPHIMIFDSKKNFVRSMNQVKADDLLFHLK
jgi:peroxiredoxin